eukprot:PhF_6_TR29359/c0_g1_i1/m.43192/K14569/BMS1; ribosome biogenesis protein BMS1
MRHRFWQEVAQGSKLFYLTGMERNSTYKRKEIVNLNHFLLVTKPMEQKWKASHPFVLADRFEDITDAEMVERNPVCDRDVAFFGYVRGKPFKENQPVHIPGVGDFISSHIMWLRDPCSAPTKSETKKKARSLSSKDKKVYAPMADIGEMTYDDDAVYVRVDQEVSDTRGAGEGHQLIQELQNTHSSKRHSSLMLHDDTNEVLRRPAEHLLDDLDDGDDGYEDDDVEVPDDMDDEEDDDDYEDYDEDDDTRRGLEVDTSLPDITRVKRNVIDWSDITQMEGIRDMFVTGKWLAQEGGLGGDDDEEDAGKKLDKGYESVTESDEEDAAVTKTKPSTSGRFHDPELEEMAGMFLQNAASSGAGDAPQQNGGNDAGNTNNGGDGVNDSGLGDDYWRRKQEKKAQFDDGAIPLNNGGMEPSTSKTFYEKLKSDAESAARNVQNTVEALAADVDQKVALLGYYSGLYVRVVIKNVPVEFTRTFQPDHPVILGGLLPGEDAHGVVYSRVKRHRWYKKILKSNDPVVFSVGWRRFQTQPIYAMEDTTGRQRFLKYTPLHMHCVAAFYGPMMLPNTGVCAIALGERQTDPTQRTAFRVLMTGYTMEVANTCQVVKKLKIVGYPETIHKNTVFVKDMFSSSAEAAKYEGAKLRTVSGIRGAIKKALAHKEGLVRCTFEDKLLKSDIVFLRTFSKVEPHEFYNPVTNLLTDEWAGMRVTRDVRKERDLPLPTTADSQYLQKAVHNKAHDRPFMVPTGMGKDLPFADKVKTMKEPATIGIPKRLRNELEDLATARLDVKEATRNAMMEHFQAKEEDLIQRDAVVREKKRQKAAKAQAEADERKQRLMKKFKKEHSKLEDFRKKAGKRSRS